MLPDRDNLMDFAARTAEAAGKITLLHFGSAPVDFKGDGSEVTAADIEAEDYIRQAISERFPDHGLVGEEGGSVVSTARHRWIIDPIDGTRSFATGVPLYGILLALEDDGVPILGCCHLPALGETVVAATGAGTWRNGYQVRVSVRDALADARLVTSGLEYWRDWATTEGRDGFDRLVGECRFARTWGDCFGYMLIATGRAEVMADPACGAHWDYAPIVPILAEAGARFTTLGGNPVGPWTSALASNGAVHTDAIACWGSGTGDDALQIPEIFARQAAS